MILGIESSCDETAIAILDTQGNLLEQRIASQIKFHRKYGGVMPELAARKHAELIHDLIQSVQSEKWSWSDLSHIAVTTGPGLETSLLIGVSVAKTLGALLDIPVIPVNHLHGHLYSVFFECEPQFPFMTLLVSGGHTLLILAKNHFEFEVVGQSLDDACGEAFDKVARLMGLPYPGGPSIEIAAKDGRPTIQLPKPVLNRGLVFSFSGLKTSVRQWILNQEAQKKEIPVADLAASFQSTVADLLSQKAIRAAKQYECQDLVLVGGVAANQFIRQTMTEEAAKEAVRLLVPNPKICTDNAAMIAKAAYYQIKTDQPLSSLSVNPRFRI